MGKICRRKIINNNQKKPYLDISDFGNQIYNRIRKLMSGSSSSDYVNPDATPPIVLKNNDTSIMKHIAARLTLPGGWIVQRNSRGIAASHLTFQSLTHTVARSIVLTRDGDIIVRANGNMVPHNNNIIGYSKSSNLELTVTNQDHVAKTISLLAFRINDLKICSGNHVARQFPSGLFDHVTSTSDGVAKVTRADNCHWLGVGSMCGPCRDLIPVPGGTDEEYEISGVEDRSGMTVYGWKDSGVADVESG